MKTFSFIVKAGYFYYEELKKVRLIALPFFMMGGI
jgi:hypothetical protein